MIKLVRADKPAYLTPETATKLTEEYKSDNKKSVWNQSDIKDALMASSHGKCAYCECSVQQEATFMEVEHFEDKARNPDKVVCWENLLPSCKRCNGYKGTHDVISEPIINPYNDEPRNHLGFKLYRLKGLTDIGKRSVDVVRLNDRERLVAKRFEIGEWMTSAVEVAREKFDLYKSNPRTATKNRLIGYVLEILKECQPEAIHSSVSSTVVLNEDGFTELIEDMKNNNIWNDELAQLYDVAQSIRLKII